MSTAYIVSQSCVGEVRSKATYRVLGTLVAAVSALFFLPPIIESPELTLIFLALWVGICLTLSVIDRTPKAYFFMLSGYTLIMIASSAISQPSNLFSIAISRTEEIIVGILCAVLVHSLIFPQTIEPRVITKIDKIFTDIVNWFNELQLFSKRVIAVEKSEAEILNVQQTLAIDITELRIMSTHLPYDTSHLRFAAPEIHALQNHVTELVPLLLSIEDRFSLISTLNIPLSTKWISLIDEINANLFTQTLTNKELLSYQAKIALLTNDIQHDDAVNRDVNIQKNQHADWHAQILFNLSERLNQFIHGYIDCLLLRRKLEKRLAGQSLKIKPKKHERSYRLHRNYGLALLSALSAIVAIMICGIFWLATGWQQGSVALLMAAIFASLFAAQDNPIPTIKTFFIYTLVSIPLSAFYILVFLPLITDFTSLALVLFPPCFVIGIFMAKPKTTGKATAVMLGFAGSLALHDTQTANLVTFINNMTAQLLGVGVIMIVILLMRKVSAAWSIYHLQRANWKEIVQLTAQFIKQPKYSSGEQGKLNDSTHYTQRVTHSLSRILDRMGLLQTRQALLIKNKIGDEPETRLDIQQDLRFVKDILELIELSPKISQAQQTRVKRVITVLHAYYRKKLAQQIDNQTLLRGYQIIAKSIDVDMSRIKSNDFTRYEKRVMTAMIGVRCGLYHQLPQDH